MKTFWVSIIMGIFGAIAVSVSFALAWPTWVMFIAYVSYYIFGRNLRNSFSAFFQIVLGVAMGVFIQLTGTFLGAYIGQFGFPVAVFIFIGLLPLIALSKNFNNIPAWFLGLIIFFGIHPAIAPIPLSQLAIPIVAGFIFAWLNDSAVKLVSKQPHHAH
jgi:hypothetical protein